MYCVVMTIGGTTSDDKVDIMPNIGIRGIKYHLGMVDIIRQNFSHEAFQTSTQLENKLNHAPRSPPETWR